MFCFLAGRLSLIPYRPLCGDVWRIDPEYLNRVMIAHIFDATANRIKTLIKRQIKIKSGLFVFFVAMNSDSCIIHSWQMVASNGKTQIMKTESAQIQQMKRIKSMMIAAIESRGIGASEMAIRSALRYLTKYAGNGDEMYLRWAIDEIATVNRLKAIQF